VLNVEKYPATTPYLTCQTFNSTAVPKTVGDKKVTSTYVFTKSLKVVDAGVKVQFSGTANTNLNLKLKAPDGTTVVLDKNVGSPSYPLINTTYDDEATVPPTYLLNGVSYQPEPQNRLSALDELNAQGKWKLLIIPNEAGSHGVLNAWSLNLCSGNKPGKPALQSPEDGSSQDKEKVKFNWEDAQATDTYRLLVRQDAKNGATVLDKSGLQESKFAGNLDGGHTYFWRVFSYNSHGKNQSAWNDFVIPP
jgi:subtilisin-like proprotein convertase family protein